MEGIIKFIENLIEDLRDTESWTVSGIVEIRKFSKDGKEFCKIKGKDEILTIVGAITREGCIVTNATLQTNELRWINGDGFIKLK